ncbi:MAG: ketopantoate reductase family protein [Nitrospirae bacterium]|nr:ketopantoate reductase family protein [Nitrospirota bacterium]
MKILVVGAGAVGGYFGTLLHQSGADITFLVRPATDEVIRQKGLTVESYKGNMTIQPRTVLARDLSSPFDLIILSVKCYDLETVFEQIKPVVSSDTILLTLQNGVNTEERLIQQFGSHKVIGGVAFITSKLIEPGRIGHYKRGIITIGELNGEKTERLEKIHELLVRAKITAYVTDEIMKKKWEKLCWNATFNPLSILFNGPVERVLESKGALDVIRQVISEIIVVAKQVAGITLNENIAEETISNTYGLKEYHTSMYEDWKSGKKTENDYLNGDIYQKGLALNIPVPMNFALYQAVKALTLP